jgi:outer membrane protein assembly factor BamB
MLKLKDHFITGVCLAAAAMLCGTAVAGEDPTTFLTKQIAGMKVGKHDWPQWGGSTSRNNTPDAKNVPITWDVESGENILWSMPLGSETYGNPVIANGKVYVGTNNGNGYIERYASSVDLGCLICFDEKDGKFLWQHSSEKLSTGRVHDWPNQGICASPFVDGNRLWYVSSRGCVVCLDTEGFLDGENDSPYVEEQVTDKGEADVVWELDMMKELSVSQHNMCSCSITSVGDLLFVNTGNGVDEGHFTIPEEGAPSFICINRNSGQVLWTDKSPGANILHGQWSSPAYGVFDGVAQVLFAGGDGYMYSFSAEGKDGKSELLWKFDCNPKRTLYTLTRATRNHLIAIPVVYDGSTSLSEKTRNTATARVICGASIRQNGAMSVQRLFTIRKNPISQSHLSVCKRWTKRQETSNAKIQILQRFGTILAKTPAPSKQPCTARWERLLLRTTCCLFWTSVACFTALMPRRAKVIGHMTCLPNAGVHR